MSAYNRGMINAAAVGILAAGLLVLIPRAVLAVSLAVEELLRHLVLPQIASPTASEMVLLLAVPTLHQLYLAVVVIYLYGMGTQGRPEEDRRPHTEFALVALALALVALSTAQHATRAGWGVPALTLPFVLQGVALVGLATTRQELLTLYGPAGLVFAVMALLAGATPAVWPDLLLVLAIPVLAFAIGRLMRLVRLQCSYGRHATMAVALGFVTAFAITQVVQRLTPTA